MPDTATPTETKGNPDTRERILAVAELAVLDKGFASTSIEEIIAAVGITKSGFFYHFKDKNALAKALLQRYLDNEEAILDNLFDRARELHEDPLHAFLIGLKLFAELMSDLPSTHPGCLVAAYCYQDQLFSQDIRDLSAEAVFGWRKRFRTEFDIIAERYPPKGDVDLDGLADMVSALVDGGIILSKVAKDKDLLPQQVLLYREFIRTIFLGTD